MKTQTKNGKQYYLHQSAGGKNIWKPVQSKSDLQIIDVQDTPSTTVISATVSNVRKTPLVSKQALLAC